MDLLIEKILLSWTWNIQGILWVWVAYAVTKGLKK